MRKITLMLTTLATLLNGIACEKTLRCSYSNSTMILWPENQFCILFSPGLPSSQENETFTFSGTEIEKNATQSVYFYESSAVDFIPSEIFVEFPALTGVLIIKSNLQEVRNGYFSSDFEKIEYLHLGSNQISKIEDEAFAEMAELKWLRLSNNSIESLPPQLFKYNPKLEYINFVKNKIWFLNPQQFYGLRNLKVMEFKDNNCINKDLGCETCELSFIDILKSFSECFIICKLFADCPSHIEVEGSTLPSPPNP